MRTAREVVAEAIVVQADRSENADRILAALQAEGYAVTRRDVNLHANFGDVNASRIAQGLA